jgi:hypothetical protein
MVMAGRTFLTISGKVIQPFILFNLIKPWLQVFPIPQLSSGFSKLQTIINHLISSIFAGGGVTIRLKPLWAKD